MARVPFDAFNEWCCQNGDPVTNDLGEIVDERPPTIDPNWRTCTNCGHKRDVHGAYQAAEGWRCNFSGGRDLPRCECAGFQPTGGVHG